jgi:hypothetical protein
VFDREEWRIAKDSKVRVYCEVINNTVVVMPARKREYEVYIKVPSDLFSYLKEVCRYDIDKLRRDNISFYLEEADGLWYFGMAISETENSDLWMYKDLPGWAYRQV